jgi:hypothetical protein
MNSAMRQRIRTRFSVLVLTGLMAAGAAFAFSEPQETATREFEKTLTLSAGQTFSLDHKFGDVHLHAENGREVRISATMRAQGDSQEEAKRYVEQIRIDVSQDGQGIKVRTIYPDDSSPSFVLRIRSRKGPSYSVDYDIAVPVDAKLWVKNGFGNVELRGIHGWSDIENSHGQLTMRDGGAGKLTNSFGSVEAEGGEGNLTVTNNNGSVSVSTVKGAGEVQDRFASITVKNVEGAVTITGSNGSVELTDAGATTINDSFGSVNVRNIHGNLTVNDNNGAVDVNTVSGSAHLNGSFGSIHFSNVTGYVKCTASNGKVSGGPTGDEVYVKTSFGEVVLEQIGGALTVEDSNGNIVAKEVKGKAEFNTSFGSIEANGLRKGVKATTGNGRIGLSDVGGDTFAKTSFGAVSLQRVNGNVTIENSNGPVEASAIKGDAKAKTSFGGVMLDDIAGAITVDNQNGAVMVSAAPTSSTCRPITIKTSFAPIQVHIAENANYNLTARTSFGRLHTEVPVETSGDAGSDSFTGKIGSGGCSLSLTNSNGNIEILKFAK